MQRDLLAALGEAVTFAGLAVVCGVVAAWTWRFVPETGGKPLAEAS